METFEVQENVAVDGPSRSERLWARIRQMSNTERNCLIVTLIISILLALLIIAIILFSIFGGYTYCLSTECVKTAAHIIHSMNSSADPCTDFYEFACGGWKNIGGDEEDNWSVRMVKDTTRQTSDLLSRNSSENEFEAVKKARSLYRQCMAVDVLDNLGMQPLFDILERAGLPRGVPNRQTALDFDLTRTLARVHRTLGRAVLIDVLRETEETFTIWMPHFELGEGPSLTVLDMIDTWVAEESNSSRTDQANGTFNADWQGFSKSITEFADGLEALKARRFSARSGFNDQVDFVPPRMRRMRLPASMITDILYNGSIPADRSNTIFYEVYMETLLEGKPEVNWNISTGTVRLADPEYHEYLVTTLKNYSALHMQMLVWLAVVKHFGVHSTTDLRKRMKSRQMATKSQGTRSESCAELVIFLMPVAVEHLLGRVDPKKEITEEVKAMIKKIQISQRELVQKVKWFDQQGLRNILRHLEDVKVVRVGYIDWVVEGRGLDEFFKDVIIHEGELLRTMADIQVWQAEANLLVSPKIGRLRTDHVMASAYYFRILNTITVRPMVLRYPFYPLGLEALNYGAMGLVLGHEFGHALDAEAFTSNDFFHLEDASIIKMDEFVNCTKKRILDFSVKLETPANPDQSLNEDISDITGIKAALYTFQKTRQGPEPYLLGLETFTHDQLFFLAFANVWCTNGKPPGPDADEGPHNANHIRILSAASNTPEFAEIWNCPPNTPMNPPDKCTFL